MGAVLFPVVAVVSACLFFILELAWRSGVAHRTEMLELRCTRLETELRHLKQLMEDKEGDE